MKQVLDDKLMQGYLLDTLAPADREAVNERLGADASFFEQMEAFEDDLILKWHRGELSEADRLCFDEAYAAGEKRARIESVVGFTHWVQAAATPEKAEVVLPVGRWMTTPVAVPKWAAVLAAVLVVGIVTRQLFSPPAGRSTLAVRLTAIGERGTDPATGFDVIRLSPRFTDLELQVKTPSAAASEELIASIAATDRGTTIQYQESRLNRLPGDTWLTLVLPASELPDGDYVLTIQSAASSPPSVLARQAFRIQRTGS